MGVGGIAAQPTAVNLLSFSEVIETKGWLRFIWQNAAIALMTGVVITKIS